MRVIDSYSPLQSIDRLGYDDDTLARLQKSLARPDGLVLVTGPTGSGKTTALYAALGHLRTGRTNIVTRRGSGRADRHRRHADSGEPARRATRSRPCCAR